MPKVEGLKITTNISDVEKQFDEFIAHVQDGLSQSFELKLNLEQTQQQFQNVNDAIKTVKENINNISSDNDSKPLIDSTDTIEQAKKITGSLDELKEQLSALKDVKNVVISAKADGINQATGALEKLQATITTINNEKIKLNYETGMNMSDSTGNAEGLLDEYKISSEIPVSSISDKSQIQEQNEGIKQQNDLYKQSQDLLNQQYKLQTQINDAESKGKDNTLAELQAQKDVVDAKLQESKTNLTSDNQSKILEQEAEYQNKLNVQEAGFNDNAEKVNAQLEKQVASFKELAGIKIQNLESSINNAFKGADTSKIKDEVASLKELQNTANTSNIGEKQAEFNTQLKQSQADLKSVNTEAKNSTGIFGDLANSMGKMAAWTISGGILFGLADSFKKGVAGAVQMDSALATLQISLNGTKSQMSTLQQSIQQTAVATGSSVNDITEAVKTYANASESASSSIAKAKSAIELANVSGLDIKSTVDGIHGVIQEYNLSGGDIEKTSQQIGSAMVSIAKNTSLDFGTAVQDMTEGIETVGSTASTVGKQTYQQTAAMIDSISEKTRNSGTETANALKTIMARVYKNTDVDPNVTQQDMGDTAKMMDKLGVSVMDASGKYRNFNDIIKDVNEKEKGMTDAQKDALATQAAGVRQMNVFQNAVESISKTQTQASKATSDSSALQDANNKYMDTAAAKAKALGAELTSMWNNLIDTSAIKGGLDTLNSLVTGINNVIQKFGLLPVVLATVGVSMAALNEKWSFLSVSLNKETGKFEWTGLLKTGFDNIKKSMDAVSISYDKYIKELTEAKGEEVDAPSRLTKIEAGMKAVNESTVLSTIAVKGFSLAMNMLAGFGIGIAIDTIISGFQKVAGVIDNVKSDISDLSSKMNTSKQDDSLIKNYEQLQQQLKNTSKSSSDYNEIQSKLNDTEKQLAQAFPSLVNGYDKEGNAIVTDTKALQNYTNAQKELLKIQSSTDYNKMFNVINQASTHMSDLIHNLKFGSMGDQNLTEIQLYTKYMKLYDQETKNGAQDTKGYASVLKNVSSDIQSFNQASIQQYQAGNKNAMYVDMATGKLEKYSTYLKQSTDATNKDTKSKQSNSSATSSLGSTTAQAGNQVDAFGNDMSKSASDSATMADKVKSAISSLEGLNGALEKVHSGQSLDAQDMLTLVENNTELLGAVQKTKDGYTINENALKDLIAVKKADAEAGILSQITNTQTQITDTQNTINNIQQRIKAYADEGNAVMDLAKKIAILRGEDNKSTDTKDLKALSDAQKKLDSEKASLANLQKEKSTLDSLYNDIGTSSGGGSGSEGKIGSDKSPEEKAEEAAQKQQDAEKKQEEAESKVLQAREDDLNRAKTSYDNSITNQVNALEEAKTAYDNSVDNAYNVEKQQEDAIIKGYQTQLDQLQQKKDLQDENNTLLKDQNDLIKAQQDLQNAQNEKNVRVYENGQWVWSADEEAVSKAQDTLSEAMQTVAEEQANIAEKAQETALNNKITTEQDKESAYETNYQNQKTATDQNYQAQEQALNDRKTQTDQGYQAQEDNLNEQKENLQGYADGTDDASPGDKQIAENGIELLIGNQVKNFQGGETVINNSNVQKLAQSVSTNNGSSNSSDAVSNTKDTLSTIGKTITSNKQLVTVPETNLLNEVNNEATDFVNNSGEYAKNTEKNIGDSVNTNKQLTRTPITNLKNEIISEITEFVNNSGQYSMKSTKNIGEAVTSTEESVKTPVGTLISNVKNMIDTFVKNTYNQGKDMDTQLGKGITDGESDLNKIVDDLCTKIIDEFHKDLGIHSPSTVMYQIGQYMMQGLINGMNEADIESLIANKLSSTVNMAQGAVSGNVVGWLQQAIQATGVSQSWLPALEKMVQMESGGNPNSVNSELTGDGEHAMGLLQTEPSTFQSYMMSGHNSIMNPVDNAIAAIRYIQDKYKTPFSIRGVSGGSYGGYANGTDNATPGIHEVGENGMELVMGDQLANFKGTEQVLNANSTSKLLDLLGNMGDTNTPNYEKVTQQVSNPVVHNHYNISKLALTNPINNTQQLIDSLNQVVKTGAY